MTPDYGPQDDDERTVIAWMLEIASEYSLENEVMWEYVAARRKGECPGEAAQIAIYAWDL